jgi:hypothetical protein
MAALVGVRRVQSYVCAGIQATGRSELAGRSFLDDPAACDRGKRVHNSTKLFSIFIYRGVFAFQIWVAERVAVTIFNRQGMEAWRTMVNDVSIEKLRDHLIICGYGQVGRPVVDQLNRLKIPFALIESDEGYAANC